MFSKPNAFEEIVNSATDENLTTENWETILAVCDKVSRSSPDSARDCVAVVQKRLGHRNANVQLYALALTDALVKNCDINVHREISSRSFTNTLVKMIHDKATHDQVRKKALELIQTCSFEFRADSSLGLMNDVYHSLRAEGVPFPNPQKPKKEFSQTELDKQKEEEELQLALALSLSETENRSSYKASSTTTSNAPKASTTANTTTSTTISSAPVEAPEEPKVTRVRALYDFQPTEQGELGFQKGDVIRVIESVYRDWWKGDLRGKSGIFPVNFVEKIVDPTPTDLIKEAEMEAEVLGEIRNVERLLDILANIDPRKDAFSENEELQTLYNSSLAIRPKLVRLIEKYSLKKDELVTLNEKFLQARVTYDRMLNDSIARYSAPGAPGNTPSYNGYNAPVENYQTYGSQPYQQPQSQQPQQYQQPSPAVSNGNINSYNGYNIPVENYQAQQTPTSMPSANLSYNGYGAPTENYQTYGTQPYPQQPSPGIQHQQYQQPQQAQQAQQTQQQQQQQQPIYGGYGQDSAAPLKF